MSNPVPSDGEDGGEGDVHEWMCGRVLCPGGVGDLLDLGRGVGQEGRAFVENNFFTIEESRAWKIQLEESIKVMLRNGRTFKKAGRDEKTPKEGKAWKL